MGASEYQTRAVYVPAVSGVMHQMPRDRSEIDPERQGSDKGIKATEVATSHAVRKIESGAESGVKDSGLESRSERSPVPDPASLVRAQELARETEKSGRRERERRAAVASASEMVGAPEDLVRLDQNRDGRIDQLELQHSLRAGGEDTTYAALSHYSKTMGFGIPAAADQEHAAEEPKKLFTEDVSKAEGDKVVPVVERKFSDDDAEVASGGAVDSSNGASRPENGVEILV